MKIEGVELLPPAARDVLHDLAAQRGLMDEQVKFSDGDGAWLIMGSALVERLQDNRQQRKRRHVDGGADTLVHEAGEGPRKQCVFVVVNTTQEAVTSVQRLFQLHTAATRAWSPPSPESVYLCLTDAGNISYYLVEPGFAGPAPPSV